MTPIIGIPACSRAMAGHAQHATPARYATAVIEGAGGIPVLIPPIGEGGLAVLPRLDGVLLSGSPSNVEPAHYQDPQDLTPDLHDPQRDQTTLPLIRAALAQGLPMLGICRGLQEINVARGGSLFQTVHAQPGRMDHRGGEGDMAHRYRPKHEVRLSGALSQLLGAQTITVNSVHGQAINRLGDGLEVEAIAPDGTIEAVRVSDASGFAFGVQWHPEWGFAENPFSLRLLQAFGQACRSYAHASLRTA